MLEMFPKEVIFLIFLAIVWIVVAVVMDFRKREVENWWNFSLIFLVLAFRAFVSVEQKEIWYFLWGLIGLGAGFLLAEAFYYARMFAGGDAKLLMALGTILPLSLSWKINFDLLLVFILAFFIGGAVYGAIYSLVLMKIHFKEFRKEFSKSYKKYKFPILGTLAIGILGLVCSIIFQVFLLAFLFILIILSPLLLVYAKALEESSLIGLVNMKDLTVGDWLAKSVKVGNRIIKPDWEGLSEEQLNYIQSKKKKGRILVKQGIPFTPAFLIGFIAMVYLSYKALFGY
jgi:Flp pilus assembly protein protease CpaA